MRGSLILVWTCIFFVFLLIRIQRPRNFPPGPLPLPLFGNLLHVNMANPLKDFERFAERCGNIFSLYTGSRPAVFLNSFEVIKEALVMKAQDFSGRPQDFMINHLSENKAKCQKEMDEVLEGKDHASYEGRHNMPYTLAVIHEVQRVANTVPLSVFHCTTKDTTLMGYSIPKGTAIITNLTTILKEEGQWKFPHEFNPDNFLNEQGQFEKPEAFIPFSTGPRVCLGEGLARMELFLVFATLLRHFQFAWPDDAGEPDYTPVYGVTLTPKPYRMHRRRETVKQ